MKDETKKIVEEVKQQLKTLVLDAVKAFNVAIEECKGDNLLVRVIMTRNGRKAVQVNNLNEDGSIINEELLTSLEVMNVTLKGLSEMGIDVVLYVDTDNTIYANDVLLFCYSNQEAIDRAASNVKGIMSITPESIKVTENESASQ